MKNRTTFLTNTESVNGVVETSHAPSTRNDAGYRGDQAHTGNARAKANGVPIPTLSMLGLLLLPLLLPLAAWRHIRSKPLQRRGEKSQNRLTRRREYAKE